MSDNTRRQREYDRIAAARISKLGGGVPRHVALGSRPSLSLRWKLKRMGLKGDHIKAALSLVDDLALHEALARMPLGVRFSTMPQARKKVKVWSVEIKDPADDDSG